ELWKFKYQPQPSKNINKVQQNCPQNKILASIFKKHKKGNPSDELATYLRESTADPDDNENDIDILEW
ncbi:18135_t:CDS:1, partial [Racocetra fulgida]